MDDFDVQRELGRGSYGVVFKVRRKIDEQVYVMKVIHIRELSKKEKADAPSTTPCSAKDIRWPSRKECLTNWTEVPERPAPVGSLSAAPNRPEPGGA